MPVALRSRNTTGRLRPWSRTAAVGWHQACNAAWAYGDAHAVTPRSLGLEEACDDKLETPSEEPLWRAGDRVGGSCYTDLEPTLSGQHLMSRQRSALEIVEATVPPSSRILRIGIIGCGAIAEGGHLPAVLSSSQVELAAISDLNASRLQYLRRRHRLGPIAFQDYREVVGRVDAVILALPNHLHAPVGVELLSRGIHVLCEKPLAVTRHECEQLTQAARSAASILAVGFVARFFPSTELTKQLLESRFLGELQSFDYEFGSPGGWSPLSGYNLARSTCGGE